MIIKLIFLRWGSISIILLTSLVPTYHHAELPHDSNDTIECVLGEAGYLVVIEEIPDRPWRMATFNPEREIPTRCIYEPLLIEIAILAVDSGLFDKDIRSCLNEFQKENNAKQCYEKVHFLLFGSYPQACSEIRIEDWMRYTVMGYYQLANYDVECERGFLYGSSYARCLVAESMLGNSFIADGQYFGRLESDESGFLHYAGIIYKEGWRGPMIYIIATKNEIEDGSSFNEALAGIFLEKYSEIMDE